MDRKVWVTIGLLAGLAFLVGVLLISSQPSKVQTDKDFPDSAPVDDNSSQTDSGPQAANSGEYLDYDESLLSRADSGNVVLFFHADWCPTCRALENHIINNAHKIPEGLTIMKLDFGAESSLRDKYDVVVQHTLVQVDSNGNQINKWIGGNTLETILRQI